MTVSENISEIISFLEARETNPKYQALRKDASKGVDFFEHIKSDKRDLGHQYSKEYIDFLSKYTDSQLLEIVTVMYTGRSIIDGSLYANKHLSFDELKQDYQSWGREKIIHQLSGKAHSNLIDNFNQGLKYFNIG